MLSCVNAACNMRRAACNTRQTIGDRHAEIGCALNKHTRLEAWMPQRPTGSAVPRPPSAQHAGKRAVCAAEPVGDAHAVMDIPCSPHTRAHARNKRSLTRLHARTHVRTRGHAHEHERARDGVPEHALSLAQHPRATHGAILSMNRQTRFDAIAAWQPRPPRSCDNYRGASSAASPPPYSKGPSRVTVEWCTEVLRRAAWYGALPGMARSRTHPAGTAQCVHVPIVATAAAGVAEQATFWDSHAGAGSCSRTLWIRNTRPEPSPTQRLHCVGLDQA